MQPLPNHSPEGVTEEQTAPGFLSSCHLLLPVPLMGWIQLEARRQRNPNVSSTKVSLIWQRTAWRREWVCRGKEEPFHMGIFFLWKKIFPLHLLFKFFFCTKIMLIHVPSNKEALWIHQDPSNDNSWRICPYALWWPRILWSVKQSVDIYNMLLGKMHLTIWEIGGCS